MKGYDDWKTNPPEEVSDNDFEEAMTELIDRMSAIDVYEIPATESLIRESFHNDVVNALADKGLDLNDDDEFVNALLDILHTMTSGALMMTVTGLAEVVREHLNNDAIERAEENAGADLAPTDDDNYDDNDY